MTLSPSQTFRPHSTLPSQTHLLHPSIHQPLPFTPTHAASLTLLSFPPSSATHLRILVVAVGLEGKLGVAGVAFEATSVEEGEVLEGTDPVHLVHSLAAPQTYILVQVHHGGWHTAGVDEGGRG